MNKEIVISVKTIFVTLLALLGIYVIYKLGPIIGILFIATLIVISMESAVKYFTRLTLFNKPLSRGAAVIISYLILTAILIGVVTFIVPPVVSESQKMIVNLSSIMRNITLPGNLELNFSELIPQASKVTTGILSATVSVFTNVAAFISLIIISIYMSLDWLNIKKNFIGIFPDKMEETVEETFEEIEKSVGAWVRGELLLMLVIGLASFVGLAILGIKYFVALAIVAGIAEAIPMIGPVISGILAGIVGFTESPIKGIGVVVLFILIQQLENNILVPKVMGRVSGFRPLMVLIALLVGSHFFGIVGAICAMPVTMIGTIILKRYLGLSK
ncbi:AI-2E family transporter [Patescibacteria group bacterium]|nr:AI-2E family transporter [Patescibacteria group bacterium]MBU1953184.1 AI-2E family transporter [Patescibacteria group bacterium]